MREQSWRKRGGSFMGFAKIKGKLTSRIGRSVTFRPPKDVESKRGGAKHGVIVDEVWARPSINLSPRRKRKGPGDWGDYSFCAQLIRWGPEDHTIRLAYYRRRVGEDHWEYASQTTVNYYWREIKALLERTLGKRGWFRERPNYPAKNT
jgi:hypothetical protein